MGSHDNCSHECPFLAKLWLSFLGQLNPVMITTKCCHLTAKVGTKTTHICNRMPCWFNICFRPGSIFNGRSMNLLSRMFWPGLLHFQISLSICSNWFSSFIEILISLTLDVTYGWWSQMNIVWLRRITFLPSFTELQQACSPFQNPTPPNLPDPPPLPRANIKWPILHLYNENFAQKCLLPV